MPVLSETWEQKPITVRSSSHDRVPQPGGVLGVRAELPSLPLWSSAARWLAETLSRFIISFRNFNRDSVVLKRRCLLHVDCRISSTSNMSLVSELVLLLLLICAVDFCTSEATPPQDVTVKPGEDAPLQCRGPTGAAITLTWSRTDLESDHYVFFFRENRSYTNYQLPSFRGRVQLRDPEMKDGDASVVLKNVTINDTGTYECRVSAARRRRRRNTPEPISTIKLTVTDSGLTAGHTEGGGTKGGGTKGGGTKDGGTKDGGTKHEHFGLLATLIVVMMIVFVSVFWTCQRSVKKNSEQPAADEADEQQKWSSP